MGLKARIIDIIHTKQDFKSKGITYPLFEALGFDKETFEKYAKDDIQFPMNIIEYDEKYVFNIDIMNNWIDVNNLRDKFNGWLKTTTREFTPERKKVFQPVWQLRHFIRDTNIKIPSAEFYDEFYDRVPIDDDENAEARLSLAPNNKLVLSGGRSRKRRRQYRSKKSRSRK